MLSSHVEDAAWRSVSNVNGSMSGARFIVSLVLVPGNMVFPDGFPMAWQTTGKANIGILEKVQNMTGGLKNYCR